MAGIYIHIPFCKQLCTYCDFYFSVSLERKNEMLAALIRDMELQSESGISLLNGKSATLYMGGGTPSVYNPDELLLLENKARSLFSPNGFNEWTVEVNPDDLSDGYLLGLRDIGVNRLSIGIQSFIDRDLQWMNRRHNAEKAYKAVEAAQKYGFKNLSIDLIYGLPQMSLSEWEYNINMALSLGVQHISAYHLILEEKTIIGTKAKKGLFTPIDDDISYQQYVILKKKLEDFGYIQYEVSNFALPTHESIHNSSYWFKEAYIGIGPSAHAYDGLYKRTQNIANNIRYIKGVMTNTKYRETELLNEVDNYNEYLLTALRTSTGINLNKIKEPFRSYFMDKAETDLKRGRLVENGDVVRIPSDLFFVSDGIICNLFWDKD